MQQRREKMILKKINEVYRRFEMDEEDRKRDEEKKCHLILANNESDIQDNISKIINH